MNATSPPTSVLLDKSVVREALRATQRRLDGQPLPERQLMSYDAIAAVLSEEIPTYITVELFHILARPRVARVARVLAPRLRVLSRGRYLRRWARRLREEGVQPEDAVIVSYASFGVDEESDTFGAAVVLTTDYALKAHYERAFALLNQRFRRMTSQLLEPYHSATLPRILTAEELLESVSG